MVSAVDCENRLTDVNYVSNNQRVAQYKYDWLGRRVKKLIYESEQLSETVKFCYGGYRVIHEYNENGTLLRRYVYGAGIDEPVAMYIPGDTWYYYHTDGLGSVVAISSQSGEVVEECYYDVFGDPSCISGVGNPYKFTGRRYDSETGLYYYRARYYNPEIGRFTSPDPVTVYLMAYSLKNFGGKNNLNYISSKMVNGFINNDPLGKWLSFSSNGRQIRHSFSA